MKDIAEIIPYGPQEPELSKITKQLYVLEQHKNPIKKINYKQFIQNIKEICKSHDFPWEYRDKKTNRRIYPNYKKNAKNWHKDYDYPGAYRVFAQHQNDENDIDLLLLEKSLKDGTIRQLFQMAQDCLDRIDELSEQEKINPTFSAAYLKRAETERYVMIMDEIRERLGIKEDNININSNNSNYNYNTDLTEDELIKRTDEYFKLLHESRP